MSSGAIRATCVEVELGAIVDNAAALRAAVGVPVVAVVKADAYGHGAVPVARALAAADPTMAFAVSLVEEGVELRDAGVTAPVLVMGPSQRGGEAELVARGLTPVVADPGEWAALAQVASARGQPVDVHVKVDTGMGRLGLPTPEAARLVATAGPIRVVGLMTHFANADVDSPDDPQSLTRRQLRAFAAAEAELRALGAPLHVRHAANSAGALFFPEARLDQVRCGLALYGGGWWDGARPTLGRRQALRLRTRVAEIRGAAMGSTVGYGATWRAARDSRLAVLPIGYADGLPRRASGRATAIVRGVCVPVVGTISMDIAIADVTDVPGCAPGDDVVLLGDAGGHAITTAAFAAAAEITEYEVTCGLSKRVPRTYLGAGMVRPAGAG